MANYTFLCKQNATKQKAQCQVAKNCCECKTFSQHCSCPVGYVCVKQTKPTCPYTIKNRAIIAFGNLTVTSNVCTVMVLPKLK